jgi:hypothetical protein
MLRHCESKPIAVLSESIATCFTAYPPMVPPLMEQLVFVNFGRPFKSVKHLDEIIQIGREPQQKRLMLGFRSIWMKRRFERLRLFREPIKPIQ